MTHKLCCPDCGGEKLQSIVENTSHTTGSNYSICSGCLGYLLLGPFGLLCGLCGQGKQTTVNSTTYWVCPDCGKKFKDPNHTRERIAQLDKHIAIPMAIAGVAFGLLFGIFFGFFDAASIGVGLGILFAVIFTVIGLTADVTNRSAAEKLRDELSELERKMASHQKSARNPKPVIDKAEPAASASEPMPAISRNANGIPMLTEPGSGNRETGNVDNSHTPTDGAKNIVCNSCGAAISGYPCEVCGYSHNIKSIPVRIIKDGGGMTKCPSCGQAQWDNRNVCFKCGQVFVNGQPGIPYWCSSCGHEGPYGNYCPKCGSSMKIHNIKE